MHQGYDGWPLLEADDRAVQDIPFFNIWAGTPKRNAYWRAVDGRDRSHALQGPALLMAGWYDPFLPTQIEDFQAIQAHAAPEVVQTARLVIGPWTHANTVTFPDGAVPRSYRLESIAPSLPWFDQHLKGKSQTAYPSPVCIFVMGANIWRNETEWPLDRTEYTAYYLHSDGHANSVMGDGQLNRESPKHKEPNDHFVYDPNEPVPSAGGAMLGPNAGIQAQNAVEAREDILVYTTPPLKQDLEVTGPVQLTLQVSTTAPNTDFTAKLVDVYPNGDAFNVSEGILRRTYSAKQSNDKLPTTITIDLWPTSQFFFQGHQIRLEVSSSNYPRFDRNPNTGQFIPMEQKPIVANQTIHHTIDNPSVLVLPIVP